MVNAIMLSITTVAKSAPRYAKRGGKHKEYYAKLARHGKVGGKNGDKGKNWGKGKEEIEMYNYDPFAKGKGKGKGKDAGASSSSSGKGNGSSNT